MFDAHGDNAATEIIPCQTATSTVTGAAVDMRDFHGKVKAILMSDAASAGTSPTLDVKLQDSADGSTGWADISGATFTQVTNAANALESIGVVIDSAARYVRAVGTIGGTATPTFAFGVCIVGAKTPVSAADTEQA